MGISETITIIKIKTNLMAMIGIIKINKIACMMIDRAVS